MLRYIDELQLLHAIRLAVVATDTDGLITFVNEAAADLYADRAEALLGRDVAALLVPERDSDFPFVLDEVLAGNTWRGDLPVRRPGGETFLAAVSATPVRDRDDVVIGAVVVAEDMTEVRRAEAEAAASEQRLRLAHEAAELGSWHWDMASGTTVWDEQLEGIYGMPPGGFDGTFEAWEATLHPEDHDRIMAVVEEAVAARSSYVLRNRIFWPDGTVRWIEAHGKVTTDERGAPTGTIGCVRDVTEQVLVQQREADAAERALLLQELTADFVSAWTPAQVETVLAAGLARVREIFRGSIEIQVPRELPTVGDGGAFLAGTHRPLSLQESQLLDTLASQYAIAAERAALQARTADIAEQLQSSLAASPLPTIEGFELAAHYAPGGDELEHVGGDWYDAVRTSEGSLALVVGDVMGRGVRAATTMIRVRAAIRGLLTVDPAPQAVLRSADDMMTRDAPDQFVTAVSVLVDPATGLLTLCNAGHVPALVVHPDGSTEALGAGSGVPLGILADLERGVTRQHLEPGALLVLVTDGVVESRDHDLDEGIARLRATAARLRERPLQELVDGLAGLADASLRDDVTVVAARVR
ncbi:SpoIIE family protein phosphatase [Nocardioides mesophilus]|uniref:SpoIIE family protein phosphatase n=1 Tax=Nocardioides mesophilus TaxID=433659 RepID=A0A7G9R8Z6_9ACTN|nr:PP2C family protein-serine/threonine phosphatase [Nocardioides mesophilus]QNN52071.1 SpoIIE family protein phosphatase [Nocardioides mesophilus]